MSGDAYEDIPEPIRRAFADQAYLPTPTMARLLGMSVKTLRRHEKAGHIRSQQKGVGHIRPPLVYTLADVAAFIRLRRLADESHPRFSSMRDHRTGSTNSRSRVIDFRAASQRSDRGPNVTRRQRKRS